MMRDAIGDHGEHDGVSTAVCEPVRHGATERSTHACRSTLRSGVDPMKNGESLRPIVLY